ncbi:hypothetical protein OGAPHI_003472 [Ogataea philodendri]|uniref:EF-hand domain-containing protein n=1 Tax=Ogataea philodendri TaxID=1378263 RepID=A0A9P8P7G6_9ASCO|nr:uncharacterized protein OGAPHI_003472 [Ogataea philodendri]KAH3666476.1 hypothetical protein OGAPHI_003472 [Ogataea philodendri]
MVDRADDWNINSLSKSQIEHFKAIFDILDQDHDGKISAEDIKNTHSSLGIKDGGDAKKMLAESGSDGLVFNAFVKFMHTKYGDFNDKNELEQVFSSFKNESNTIYADDLRQNILDVGKTNPDAKMSKNDLNKVISSFSKKNGLTGKATFTSDAFIDTVSN